MFLVGRPPPTGQGLSYPALMQASVLLLTKLRKFQRTLEYRGRITDLEIARTCCLLDASAIAQHDAAACIINKIAVAQFLSDACDAWAINAERSSDLLMRQVKYLSAAAVLHHQQPRAKPFLNGMVHIADRFLRDLPDVELDKMAEARADLVVLPEQFFKCHGFDALCGSGLRDLRAVLCKMRV